MSADYERYARALADERLPTALVDLDALDANIAVIESRLERGDVKLRVASKSIRSTGVLRYVLDASEHFEGVMTFSAHETAFLAEEGFDDLLIAYPFARADEAAAVATTAARGTRILATVDHPVQVDLLAEAARAAGTSVALCMDVDLSYRALGGAVHLGVRRSPIRSADDARQLAEHVERTEGVTLEGVLAYEAQIAGMRDITPGSRLLDPIRALIKRISRPVALSLREEIVGALRARGHDIRVVNGGGTGSVSFTSADPSVTEVTAGSGFLCPHLFSGYHGLPLRPAAFFALEVVRISDPGFVTCLGGGYVASGEAGKSRLPTVYLPEGLEPIDLEGFGEVQTPLRVTSGSAPGLGDPVLCRHAKAGELAERFLSLLAVRGDEVVERHPTYRGQGRCFL